jgi:hypothetical protein
VMWNQTANGWGFWNNNIWARRLQVAATA